MKKLLLLIPFALIGCVTPQQQAYYGQPVQQYQPQEQTAEQMNAAYWEGVRNRQRLQQEQSMINSPKTYSVMDQNGNYKTYTIKQGY